MADDFAIIAVTPEEIAPGEAAKIARLLDSGAVDFVHLRHPRETLAEMKRLVEDVPQRLHSRLRIHGHFALLDDFNLAGPHLNSRCPSWQRPVADGAGRWRPTLTRTCHTLGELADPGSYAYVTLSPIYPSISKPGYSGAFDTQQLREAIAGRRVVALGGVTPSKFLPLRRLGFYGAAMLGYVWEGDIEERIRAMRMMRCFPLQYITNGATPAEVEAETRNVLRGGCRWVQLRMKDAPDAAIAEAIARIAPLCREAKAMLLIDDRADMAARYGLDGVHLGKNDMPPSEARAMLGSRAIIGSTANTAADIRRIELDGASDYIGLGPLRFTSTKKNLSPILGIEGYRAIFSGGVSLPVVAIGSVGCADVEPLVAAGAQGVAVSGAIRNAADQGAATSEIAARLATPGTLNNE